MGYSFNPFAYQLTMRDWLREREIAALFCSPGLGKTAVSLEWLDWLFSTGRSRGALVIAPLRVGLITWPNQVKHWEFCKWMKIADLRTEEGQKAWFEGSAWLYIANFEMLSTREVHVKCKTCKGEAEIHDGISDEADPCPDCRMRDKKTKEMKSVGYTIRKDYGLIHKLIKNLHRAKKPLPVDTVVVDELSCAKNPSSKRINALRAYNSHFTYRLGLTGTPVPNTYMDLFAQIRLLDSGQRFGTSIEDYRKTYFVQDKYNEYKYHLRPGCKERIDEAISDLCLVMLGEDYLKLPTTFVEDIMVSMPAAALKAYKELQKEMLVELETGEVTALSAAALCTKLLQFTGGASYDVDKVVHFVHGAKIEALKKLRKKHGKEPMLVLTGYRHENKRILEAIPGARMFDEKDLDDWQRGKIHTWVAHPKSLSHGIDGIQKGGRIACWYTQTYSNETFIQTNARIIRTGQTSETLVYRLLVPKSIDEAVAETLREKDNEQTGCLQALKALQQLAA